MKNSPDIDKQMVVMQESMLKMHGHMHKIMDARNPQQRESLVQEHRHMLHQHMSAMKDGDMMGGDAKSGKGAAVEQKDGEQHK